MRTTRTAILFTIAIVVVASVGAVQLTGATDLLDEQTGVLTDNGDNASVDVTAGSALVFGESTDDDLAPDEPSIEDYATDEGVVDANGLRDAVDDWRSGEIDTDLLRDVVEAWRSGEPIE